MRSFSKYAINFFKNTLLNRVWFTNFRLRQTYALMLLLHAVVFRLPGLLCSPIYFLLLLFTNIVSFHLLLPCGVTISYSNITEWMTWFCGCCFQLQWRCTCDIVSWTHMYRKNHPSLLMPVVLTKRRWDLDSWPHLESRSLLTSPYVTRSQYTINTQGEGGPEIQFRTVFWRSNIGMQFVLPRLTWVLVYHLFWSDMPQQLLRDAFNEWKLCIRKTSFPALNPQPT